MKKFRLFVLLIVILLYVLVVYGLLFLPFIVAIFTGSLYWLMGFVLSFPLAVKFHIYCERLSKIKFNI